MVAVIDNDLNELLAVVLQVHLLEEVPCQLDAFLYVGAQLHSGHVGLALLHLQHLGFFEGFQVEGRLAAEVQQSVVLGVLEGQFEGAALLFQLEDGLDPVLLAIKLSTEVGHCICEPIQLRLILLKLVDVVHLFLLVLNLFYQILLHMLALLQHCPSTHLQLPPAVSHPCMQCLREHLLVAGREEFVAGEDIHVFRQEVQQVMAEDGEDIAYELFRGEGKSVEVEIGNEDDLGLAYY